MLKTKELNEILEYTKKGATLEMIAEHYQISTRTLSRRLKDHKQDIQIAREYYQTWLERMFK